MKGPEPAILVANSARWNEAYATASPTDRKLNEHWGEESIKSGLAEETAGRCAYCEADLEDVSYAHVEHMLPKSKFPHLSHTWTNLTRACQRCNTNKREYHEQNAEIFNPYIDDVEGRIRVRGAIVDWDMQDTRAEITVRKLDLNRLDLFRARKERVLQVRELLERWAGADDPIRGILAEAIRMDAVAGPFSRSVRDLLDSHGFLAAS